MRLPNGYGGVVKLSHPKKAPHPVQSVIRLCDETRNYLQRLLSLCQHHQI